MDLLSILIVCLTQSVSPRLLNIFSFIKIYACFLALWGRVIQLFWSTMFYYATEWNPKLKKYLGRTKMASEKSIHDIKSFDYPSNSRYTCKNLEATISFVDFSKTFDSIHRRKMEQILLANGQLKETVAAIMMRYKNTKVKVRSSDGNTDYFDIVAALYLFIICLDYVFRTSIDKMKDNGFKLTKERSRKYPHNYRRGLPRWRCASGKYTGTSRNPATKSGTSSCWHWPHVNAGKTEYMCFNPRGNISTLNGNSPKLVDKFTYLGSRASSTEKDIDTWQAKACTAIDWLLVI